ncbi:MAG TPA: hypothetical protein VMO26_24175 [Vicinamibacterales bacterium]|nr:hypothetical protein [Vicinamibacterales bacterium]
MAVFLLSPAHCGGKRATYLLREGSTLAAASKLTRGTLTLGEAFSFMSGLYFRGKLAYAQTFGRHDPSVLVITPTRGLLRPETPVSAALLREFAAVDVDAADERYRAPLVQSLERLRSALLPDSRVVLLGSIATGKYVDVLTREFGERLHFPTDFVGRGDMSRGGLLLRCVASGVELDYSELRPDARRHGARPPKLVPLRGSSQPSRLPVQNPTAPSAPSSKPPKPPVQNPAPRGSS